MTNWWLLYQLIRQALIGGLLGASLALTLLASNCQHLRDLIADSPAPLAVSAIFVGGISMYIAFGAAVTGFLLILQEGDSR
jgi:hypothetical protein